MDTWIHKSLKFQLFVYIITLFYAFSSAAPIQLKGVQYGPYEEGEYEITEDVIIPSGEIMTLEAGVVLRFNTYTGIKVSGKLQCHGNSLKSILFATKNSSDTSNSAYGSFNQWNGIEVDSGGALDFDRVEILNSVYGINAHKEFDSLSLKNMLFRNNTEDFKIGDSLILVDNNSLYTGKFKVTEIDLSSNIKKEKPKRGKVAFQVSLATIGVAGAAIATVYHLKYQDASNIHDDKDGEESKQDVSKARVNMEKYGTTRNFSGAIGAASLTGLIITFFF